MFFTSKLFPVQGDNRQYWEGNPRLLSMYTIERVFVSDFQIIILEGILGNLDCSMG